MAEKIIAGMPRDNVSGKALVSGGTSAVSTILLPEIAVTGRPALSILDLLPTRIVPSPSYFFLQANHASVGGRPGTGLRCKTGVRCGGDRRPEQAESCCDSEQPGGRVSPGRQHQPGRFRLGRVHIRRQVRLLETEILSGDGTGEHMTGILNTSGVVTQAFVTSTLASIRHALATLQSTGYRPGAIVLSTNDWRDLELLLATSGATDVRGLPLDSVSQRLWGVPVALHNGLGAKTGLVIGQGAVVLDSDGRVRSKVVRLDRG